MPQGTSCHQSSEAVSADTDEARPVANGDEVLSRLEEPSSDSGSTPPAEDSTSPFESAENDDAVATYMSKLKSCFPITDPVADSCWRHMLEDSLVRLPDDDINGNRGAQLALENAKRMCDSYYEIRHSTSSSLQGLPAKRSRDDTTASSKRRKVEEDFSHELESEDSYGEEHNRNNSPSQDLKTELREWLEVGMKRRDAYGGYPSPEVLDGFHDVRQKAHAYLLETLQDSPCKVKLERRKDDLITASLASCSGLKSQLIQNLMDGESVERSELAQSLEKKDSELSSTQDTLKLTRGAVKPFADLGKSIARSVYSAVILSMMNATRQASGAGYKVAGDYP